MTPALEKWSGAVTWGEVLSLLCVEGWSGGMADFVAGAQGSCAGC